MEEIKILAAGFVITGGKGVAASASGLEAVAVRNARPGQAQAERDIRHLVLLFGWQQSQWQAAIPQWDEPG